MKWFIVYDSWPFHLGLLAFVGAASPGAVSPVCKCLHSLHMPLTLAPGLPPPNPNYSEHRHAAKSPERPGTTHPEAGANGNELFALS